ncbi:MAG: HAMP domain-containing histidine kinase [Oscillospiraceae bacterium]|nr:HAMP domain-containing histidine kinase [Oscillospiraceae bacterium]
MRYSVRGTDRFVNNQSLRRIVIGGVVLILAAAAVCAMGSYFAADSITALFAEGKPLYYYSEFRAAWLRCFLLSFGISGLFLLAMLIWSYRQTDRIYKELALLSAEAERLSKLPDEISIAQLGSETGEIRRLCNNVERLARRTHAAYLKLVKQKKLHTDLLVNLSHQLKTSLAVIRLNRDMLDSLPLPEDEQARLAEEITLHLDGMEDLILNVLKLSRLSADAVQYQLADTDIAATCTMAAERVEPLCREHGIAVKVEISGRPHMQHDRVWFCEAVENLLKNAVDHAECTEVKVVVTELPAAVKLQVIDNGRGIPLSEIPHLFDRFRKTESKSPQNTGVGMAISKEIFSAHGGAITVYSGDSGTQFLSIFMQ